MRLVLLLSAVALSAGAVTVGDLEVVVPPDASPVARFAGDEATNFLSRALGRPVPLVAERTGGQFALVVGGRAACRATGADIASLERDAFVVGTSSDAVYIVGRDDPQVDPKAVIAAGDVKNGMNFERGTLFGVYDFLETVGCRFYFPGELGEVVPRLDALELAEGVRSVKPDFPVREVYMVGDGQWYEGPKIGRNGRSGAKVLDWLRLRLQSQKIPCCHGLRSFRQPERFATEHPDYFAMDEKGRRCLAYDQGNWANQLTRQICNSSGIWDEIYEDAKSYLKGESASVRGIPSPRNDGSFAWGANCVGGKYVDVMLQDGAWRCHCEKCRAAYAAEKSSRYYTDLVWGQTCRLANRLAADGVKGYVTQMAYAQYGDVPSMRIPDNVLVMVAQGGPWTGALEPDGYRQQVEEIGKWVDKCGHKVWLWTYGGKIWTTDKPDIPQVSPRAVGRYFKLVAPLTLGAFYETESDYSLFNYLNYYVFAKVGWNNGADVEALLAEHHRLMFGPAEGEMSEIFAIMESKWLEIVGGIEEDTPLGRQRRTATMLEIGERIYDSATLKRLEALFAAARQKAGDGTLEGRRVAFMRTHLFERMEKRIRESADAVSASKALARRKSAGANRSVIADGDFSGDGSAWQPEEDSASVGYDRAVCLVGPASMKIVSTNRSAALQYLDGVLRPGRKYRVSWFARLRDVRALPGSNAVAGAMVEFYDGFTWHWFPRSSPLLGTCDWIYQEYVYRVPEKIPERRGRPYIHLMLSQASGTAWFDDLRVEEIE